MSPGVADGLTSEAWISVRMQLTRRGGSRCGAAGLRGRWRWRRSRSAGVAASGARRRRSAVQGGVDLRRPAQRRRLVAGARPGPAVRPEDARRARSQTTYKENIPEGPQVAQVIDSLVRDGNKIIFATSFGYQTAMAAAAKKYPNVLVRAGDRDGAVEEPRRVLRRGARTRSTSPAWRPARRRRRASSATSSPFPIPEVIRHANAFALGVQATHPGAKVKLVWTNSWFDPAKEKKAAESLVAAGADVHRPERRQPRRRPVRRVEGHPVGRLRLRRAEVRAEVVADGRRLQLGPVLPEARQGGDERAPGRPGFYYGSIKDGFTASPRTARRSSRDDEGGDRREAEGDRERHVLRVRRPALRPERQAARPEGQAADASSRPLRDELARQGRRSGSAKG